MKTAKRRSQVTAGRRRRHVHSPSQHDSLLNGSERDISGLSANHKSLLFTGNKQGEKLLWISENPRLHHSETAVLSTPFGKMPQWMTMQGMEYQRRARSIPDFLSGGHYGYQHQVYVAAAEIFERLAVRPSSGEVLVQYTPIAMLAITPVFESQKVKRQAYELAYETLKYQELLEEILIDSGYFFSHPTSDDTNALVVVMLFDFLNRKWAPRCRIVGEKINKEVLDVEQAIMGHQVRLAAALARCRVKNQSLSIDYILPEAVRQQEKCASFLPQYAWINTAKTSLEKVIKKLRDNHYAEAEGVLPPRGKFYQVDCHCDDVLLFPRDQKDVLKCFDMYANGDFVLQDKTSSLAVKSVAALLTEDDECDLLHTDVLSGLTTAHLAVYLHNVTRKRVEAKQLMYGNPLTRNSNLLLDGNETTEEPDDSMRRPTVYACGVRSDAHREQLNGLLKQLGLKNVKLLNDRFENLDLKRDSRFSRVKVVLVTPQCTRTAVANPVDFMLNEGDSENFSVLRDLSHGERHNRATECGKSHLEVLKAALKVPSVQAVVYATRSIHPAENEQAVNGATRWHRDTGEGARPFRVCPPTLPLTSNDVREGEKETVVLARGQKAQALKQNFLRMRQTPGMNGCFIAVLTREFDRNDSLAAKDILKRAALQGLIAPVSSVQKKQEPVRAKSPPKQQELAEVTEEPHPAEKVKRHKSKVGFGKKMKATSSGTSAQKKKHGAKVVESVDVDKMLESYKREAAVKATKSGEMNQVNINLEFHKTSSLQFPDSSLSSHRQRSASKTAVTTQQMTTDVERMLQELTSPSATKRT